MAETKDTKPDAKDDDKQAPAAKKKETFDCSACGGTSKTEAVCSACGTMLKA